MGRNFREIYGETEQGGLMWSLCEKDPAYKIWDRLSDEIESHMDEQDNIIEEILRTPATTQHGASAKLQVGLSMWRRWDLDDGDYYKQAMHNFMQNAVQVLDRGMPT